MKKQIVITLLVTVLLSAAGSAQAGERNRGHYNGQHNSYGYAGQQRHYARNRNRYRNYGNRHYSPYRGYGRYGYGRGHRDRYKGLKIAAGAMILGSVIHAANNDRRRNVAYRSRPVVINRGYWYRVDSDGQCVEVRLNRQGQEVWTYVDSGYCY